MYETLVPILWIAGLLILALFWPLASRVRHQRLKPLAAYLLFTSVFALVSAAAFVLLLGAGLAFLPEQTMEGPWAAGIVGLLAALPAFAAAVLVVRRPQIRRMPR